MMMQVQLDGNDGKIAGAAGVSNENDIGGTTALLLTARHEPQPCW
jgi:hypothetical protein